MKNYIEQSKNSDSRYFEQFIFSPHLHAIEVAEAFSFLGTKQEKSYLKTLRGINAYVKAFESFYGAK